MERKGVSMFTSKDPELEDMIQFLAQVLDLALQIQFLQEIQLLQNMYERMQEEMWQLMLESLSPIGELAIEDVEIVVETQPTIWRPYADLAPEVPMFMLSSIGTMGDLFPNHLVNGETPCVSAKEQ